MTKYCVGTVGPKSTAKSTDLEILRVQQAPFRIYRSQNTLQHTSLCMRALGILGIQRALLYVGSYTTVVQLPYVCRMYPNNGKRTKDYY